MKRLLSLLLLLPASLLAAEVSSKDAMAAASAFVLSDAVGRTILDGRTVESAESRGRLWIISLSPSGHVIVAGSDRADPVVGFSTADFVEPDPVSPAFSLLDGTSSAMDALDRDESAGRHPRWDSLLSGGQRRGDAKAADPPASAIVVDPFLDVHYNQWQPYNDYTPVCEAVTQNDVYRGRDPCGCVATAAAQVFRHFRWPAIIGGSRTFEHSWSDRVSSGEAFSVRFDGREPFDWDAFADEYVDYDRGYELRGKVAESVRYPIARLILWADSLARMSFNESGSSANYGTVAGNVAEWYYPGESFSADGDLSPAVDSFRHGIPCPVELYGHQVLGHGWASDGGTQYIYLNFGWGGSNDGWYAIPGAAGGMTIQEVRAGHFPRAKPQIDPLPAVAPIGTTLSWHFPDFHTNALEGFFVQLSAAASAADTVTETFSDFAGSLAGEGFEIDTSAGYEGAGLSIPPYESGSCTLPGSFVLSAASVISFRYGSSYAQNSSLRLQARFDGGEWETLANPALPNTGSSGWKTASIYLGDRGGRTLQLRIANEFQGGTFYPSGWIHVDDVRVAEVFPMQESFHFTPRADERILAIGDWLLTPGKTYTATVKPILSDDALAPAETSEPISWTVAGTASVPLPGELTYEQATLSYSSSAVGDIWSVNGTQVDATSVRDATSASIEAALSGALTESSVLTFSWTAKGYYTGSYGTGSDAFTVVFDDADGTSTTLWTKSNSANQTTAQAVAIPLGAYAGRTGSIAVRYSHSGPQYTSGGYGGTIIAPKITDVMQAVVPPVAFETRTLVALGMPEILAVETAHGTDMQEGFYRECSRAGTVLYVTCSPTVTELRALPSHLTFVPDSAVTVHSLGNGEFAVEIDGSGVTADVDRTRMILTLEATDANGTTVCKDLSLRFSSASGTASEDSWAVQIGGNRVADNSTWTADIPYAWLVKNELAPKGSTDAVFAAAANADADGDGLANCGEWICGTAPTNAAEPLRVLLEMNGDVPDLGFAPQTLRDGFVPVFIGTTTLDPAAWEPVDLENHRFFRVRIERP